MTSNVPAAPPRRWAIALFLMVAAAVLWFSLRPGAGRVSTSHIDKVQHFGAYLLLGVIGFVALRGRSWRLALGLLLMGLGVEVLQAAMALGRTASVLDMLANTAGLAGAWIVWGRGARGRR